MYRCTPTYFALQPVFILTCWQQKSHMYIVHLEKKAYFNSSLIFKNHSPSNTMNMMQYGTYKTSELKA